MTTKPQSITEDISTLTNDYLAALRSNSDEIARLTRELREMAFARNVVVNLANDLITERDQARDEVEKGHADRIADNRVLLSQLDEARQDAERLASDLKDAAGKIHYWNNHESTFGNCTRFICDEFSKSLAAHAAATGKAVTT